MSNLSIADKEFLEKALQMGNGYVLDFSNKTFEKFFHNFNVDIYDLKYSTYGESKAKRLRRFFELEQDETVAKVLAELAKLCENQEFEHQKLPKYSARIKTISDWLLAHIDNNELLKKENDKDEIQISLHPEIYNHIEEYLYNEDYFHAVEEGYKLVRQKLRELTGEEQATKAFAVTNYEVIFGHTAKNDIEKDFFEGVKFLNMAIQFFRNENAHSVAKPLKRNMAIHYLVLTSLAYYLITNNEVERI